MTDKQEVIDIVNNLPENVSLEEIIEELRILAGVRKGRAAIVAGRTKTQDEVERMVETWFSDRPTQS